MKKLILFALVFLMIVPVSGFCEEVSQKPQNDAGFSRNINFFLGVKGLDDNDWGDNDDHAEFAVMFDFKQKSWPFSLAFDSFSSYDEQEYSGGDIETATGELGFGIRKIWDVTPHMHPFIGGGGALFVAEIENEDNDDDDDADFGFWCSGGIYWTINRHFNIGVLLRHSDAEVTLFNTKFEAGGSHFGMLLGYYW